MLLRSFSQWAAIAVSVSLGIVLFAFVDLEPKVQADFFFASDDPQLRDSRNIEREFGSGEQIFIAARSSNLVSREYIGRLYRLTEDLRKVKGVVDVRSLTHGPKEPEKVLEDDPNEVFEEVRESPFWSRLLLASDHSATSVVLRLSGTEHRTAVNAIDRVIERHSRSGFKLGVSGVPYVGEHIRTQLSGDLYRFSIAAFVAFAVLVTVLFRSVPILIGTLVASVSASFATFIARAMLGMPTDILAPNLWTIAFVLTLSHIVYLTAEWRRRAREVGSERAARESVRVIGPASLWSLAANLLGFASLIFVSAKPLRQFGISGGIAALLAIVCAYSLYPPFLRAANPGREGSNRVERVLDGFFTRRHGVIAVCVVVVALLLAPFVWEVNTDPSLPSYFAGGERIRTGLESIDRSSGSSPLDIVVTDKGGQTLDNDESFERLEVLQRRLERHRDVGSVLSIALLMAETDRKWYSFLFSWKTKLKQLEKPEHGRIGNTFISDDRRQGRFILRMRESARARPRQAVIDEIESIVTSAGFKPVHVGGLYPAQGELSKLVEGSVVRGLGGLLGCFSLIVWIVTRSFRRALAMTFCLALTPFALFGLVGLLGMPLDIISAPAANVALPLGIDEMIHIGYAVRRAKKTGDRWKPWRDALSQLWAPILASLLIVTSGFALFLLSSFPPTQRLGVLVCVGTAITDLVVLLVLPAVATIGRRAPGVKTSRPLKAA